MKYLYLFIAFTYTSLLSANDFTIDTLILESDILNETRHILMYLPADFDSREPASIVYLLDGEFSKYRYEKIADDQFSEPLIGIAIMNTKRNRDLLPVREAENYLQFIEELIPVAEADILVDNRILFGHSFGGCFTIYTMINRPQLFEKYIASSPTPIMDMVDASIYQSVDSQLKKDLKFYFSHGSKDMKQVRKWCAVINDNLKNINTNHIQWKFEIYEGENHNTCDVISLLKGLKY